MSRDNNFNLMRILAALAVLVSHSYTIVTGDVGREPLEQHLGVSLGSISVDMFFAVSGFLVVASYFNQNSMSGFIRSRALRILPGLVVMLSATVLFLGCFVAKSPLIVFLIDPQTWVYFSKNAFMFSGAEYRLNYVFENNPYPNAVNGSLWTLPHEVRAYFILALMCFFGSKFLSISQIRRFFLLFAVIFLGVDTLSKVFNLEIVQSSFIHLFGVFLLGAVLYLYKVHTNRLLMPLTFFCATIMLVAGVHSDLFAYIYSWLIPLVSIGLAYIPFKKLHFYNRFGDYSYGVYIYAFPIQQTLVFFQPDISVFWMISYATILSLMAAYFSWHFIEKPCLALK